jgi:hypothetical protein
MHGTPLLPPKGDHEVYMSEEDDQGHSVHPHAKGNRNRDSIQRTTGYDLRGKHPTPDDTMPEQRDKKRSIGEAGEK